MGGYEAVCSYAQKLGLNDAADLLEQTLKEEEQADEDLTALSDELLADAEK